MKPIRLSMDEVQQLCTEIRTLTAAGLPLEHHLADAGRGHGQRINAVCEEISRRLENGESIETIVADQKPGPSRMLAAALAAGVQTGEMNASVELLGDLAADLVAVRTQLTRAMAYPLVICVIAGMLFLVAIRRFLQEVFLVLVDLGSDLSPVVFHIMALDERYPQWTWVVPGGLLLVILVWVLSGRSGRMAFRGPERLLLLIPGVRSLIRDLQFYTLTRMTWLLVERELPLPTALLLAGGCVGNRHLEAACAEEAGRIRRGARSEQPEGRWQPGQMPPLLQVSVAHEAQNDGQLLERLMGVAAHYQRRMGLNLAWLQHVIPGALLVLFGGGAVFVYGVILMWPVAKLYESLQAF